MNFKLFRFYKKVIFLKTSILYPVLSSIKRCKIRINSSPRSIHSQHSEISNNYKLLYWKKSSPSPIFEILSPDHSTPFTVEQTKTHPDETSLRLYHPFFSSLVPFFSIRTHINNFRLKIRTSSNTRSTTPAPVDDDWLDVEDGGIVLLLHCGSWIARIRANEVVPSTFLSCFLFGSPFLPLFSTFHDLAVSLRLPSPPSSSTFSPRRSFRSPPGTRAFQHPRPPLFTNEHSTTLFTNQKRDRKRENSGSLWITRRINVRRIVEAA